MPLLNVFQLFSSLLEIEIHSETDDSDADSGSKMINEPLYNEPPSGIFTIFLLITDSTDETAFEQNTFSVDSGATFSSLTSVNLSEM